MLPKTPNKSPCHQMKTSAINYNTIAGEAFTRQTIHSGKMAHRTKMINLALFMMLIMSNCMCGGKHDHQVPTNIYLIWLIFWDPVLILFHKCLLQVIKLISSWPLLKARPENQLHSNPKSDKSTTTAVFNKISSANLIWGNFKMFPPSTAWNLQQC